MLISFGLVACGGGCDAPPGRTVTAPVVTLVTPVDGSTDVEPTTTVRSKFSEEMFAKTIHDGSFTLSDANGTVSADVSFDPLTNIATLTSTQPLFLLQEYTASLDSTISDLEGDSLEPKSWTFTTRDGGWGNPLLIESDDSAPAFTPQIAFDNNGNALAVWTQYDGTLFNIWSNRYAAGAGWGTPSRVASNDLSPATYPQIAMDNNGHALAVWSQTNRTRYNIWANRYTASVGWGTASPLESDNSGNATYPQIAVDNNGHALAVWQQSEGTRDNIWANRFE